MYLNCSKSRLKDQTFSSSVVSHDVIGWLNEQTMFDQTPEKVSPHNDFCILLLKFRLNVAHLVAFYRLRTLCWLLVAKTIIQMLHTTTRQPRKNNAITTTKSKYLPPYSSDFTVNVVCVRKISCSELLFQWLSAIVASDELTFTNNCEVCRAIRKLPLRAYGLIFIMIKSTDR